MKKRRTTRVNVDKSGNVIAGSPNLRSRTDWRRVDALTDEDIKLAVGHDRDTRVLTVRDLKASYHVPAAVDVRQLRLRLHMSQAAFARKYGFSIDALQDWEQGRVSPSRSARVLLTVIAREPTAVDRALYGTHARQPRGNIALAAPRSGTTKPPGSSRGWASSARRRHQP